MMMMIMKETFTKKYIVERTNKAEIRPEGHSGENGELSGEFMERSTVERTVQTETDAKSWIKGSGASSVGLCQET